MATLNMKDMRMNNWPNQNALGEPKFPEIARTHFLRYIAEDTGLNMAPDHVMVDTVLPGVWNPLERKWFVLGEFLSVEEIGRDCDYISPAYTENELRQAKRDIIEDAITDCEFVGDQALDDAESRGAYACAEYIRKWQKDI